MIVLTQRMKQLYLKDKLVDPSKLRVIPDGVDLSVFRDTDISQPQEFLKTHRLPEDSPIVTYVGRIAPEKGWQVLVDAAAQIDNKKIRYLICGDGHQRKKFEKYVNQLGLSSQFVFTGFIPRHQIALAMRLSRYVVLPSFHEELGGTMLEGMACGTPIIASNVGGIPSVISDKVDGFLFPPGASRQLAEIIDYVLNRCPKIDTIKSNASLKVKEIYSIQTIGRQLEQNYSQLAQLRLT